jgi:LacI family transcriptional regulator
MAAATMKDVAERAGVSTTTVSHVINQTRFVSEENRSKVQEAMKALGYQPNAIAKSLRQKSTNTIGLMISDIANPFFTSLIRGVEDVANAAGFNLILCNTDEKPEKEYTYLDVLQQKQVDGVIVAPTGENLDYFEALVDNGFPMVFIDRRLEGIACPAVLADNENGSYEAVSHLIGLGHRRIGIVVGLLGVTSTTERLRGYQKALAEHGLPFDKELVLPGKSKVESGREAALQLLALTARPSAIFATNNQMTIGVMRALHEQGVRCPDDMAVVGFDDFEWASAFRPLLTTVAQPVYDMGRVAAETLIERIRNKGETGDKGGAGVTGKADRAGAKQVITLGCTLVVRESCGAGGAAAATAESIADAGEK